MNTFIYDIPVAQISAYRDHRLIVRTHDPARLPTDLAAEDPETIIGIRLLSLSADSAALNPWAPGLPLELVMTDPATEYPLLYRHTNLLDNHPVWVAIPVLAGFGKAVKVAIALNFAVRLEIGQPEPALIEELCEMAQFYLRQPTVAQPVEFFHSTLLGFYHNDPAPLWVVLDDDPVAQRYVGDDGAECVSTRLAEAGIATDSAEDLEKLLTASADCQSCEFLGSCGGYFKWPKGDYECAGVKRLFGELRDAAAELRNDLTATAMNHFNSSAPE